MKAEERVRLMIVDDHPIYRCGLRAILDLEGDVETVAEASSGAEALAKAAELLPDVILMDVKMRGMDGPETTRQIKAAHPSVQIIGLSGYDDEECVFEMVKAGAIGYLLKDSAPEQLLQAIRQAAKGGSQLDPLIARRVLEEFAQLATSHNLKKIDPYDGLSSRELEVLRSIATGHSNKEVASHLCISERTVENHVRNIYQKLHIRDRSQAILYAVRKGLIEVSESPRG
ncbi:MAG: response regulator transcription factor [Dehalococcoidales bacterium]|nr:response regulator transcription factor [Dehalococcoidales bacterium]